MFGKAVALFAFLLTSPLWAQVTLPITPPTLPTVGLPGLSGTCDCPVVPNLNALVCVLDWVSHAKILNHTKSLINGMIVNEYTLQHITILDGAVNLPTVLIIPEGPCGLELQVGLQYLLSGLLTGNSQLYTTLCLQVLNTVANDVMTLITPLWSLVPPGLANEINIIALLQDVVCLLLGDVLPILEGLITIPPEIGGLFPTVPLPTIPVPLPGR
ncbi:unnamed protein product, partial [Mesorhabditis belari]|uniref:Secreted protein n=1 Tax=Mesorhabditis belari TaxID=2138241 RepID=A0AAF3FQK8_9BILA